MLYEDIFYWLHVYIKAALSAETCCRNGLKFLILSCRELYWWWQMRVCCQVGLWVKLEYPAVYQWNRLEQKWWFGDGVGLSPAALSASCCCLSVSSMVFATWERYLRDCVYEVWTGNQKQEPGGELVVASWWWTVSTVLWSFFAGTGVETAPQGWIHIKGFITPGLYTIYPGEIIQKSVGGYEMNQLQL